jgi:hypothetical protein
MIITTNETRLHIRRVSMTALTQSRSVVFNLAAGFNRFYVHLLYAVSGFQTTKTPVRNEGI